MDRIRISLLPSELKRESSIMRRWTLVAMVMSIVAVIVFLVSFMFNVYLQGPIDELDSLKVQNSLMTENISRLSYIQEMFDTIEHNNGIITTLKGKDVDWTFVFNLSSNNLTLYNISVKQIGIDAKVEGVNGTIIGQCGTINEMTAWAEATENLAGIDSVQLSNLKKLQLGEDESAFSFEAHLVIINWNEE